eukprot:scaffold401_cov399-Prasinococcus_capsulatus_cf.AAC.22
MEREARERWPISPEDVGTQALVAADILSLSLARPASPARERRRVTSICVIAATLESAGIYVPAPARCAGARR